VVLNIILIFVFIVRKSKYLYQLGLHKINRDLIPYPSNKRKSLIRRLRELFKIIDQFLIWDFVWNISYHTIGILNTLNPLLTCFMLLDLFRKISTLKNIVKAILVSKKKIFNCVIMFIFLTYYTSIIKYYVFYEEVEPICESLLQCFLHIFDVTVK
jgi:hypothetical protein